MTIILPISSAKLGKSVHSSISIPKVEDPNPSRIPSGSIPMGLPYAKRGTAWFTGDSVPCKKEKLCSCRDSCSSSHYGRCIYTKPDWDIRLYTPVPRGTSEYKNTYKNRTSCERVNDRVLNDYQLHNMKIHTKKRYSFFLWLIGTNIHLDARLKKLRLQTAA